MQAKVLEDSSLLWAVVQVVGLANFYNYFMPAEVVDTVVKPPRKDGVTAGSK